MSLAERILKGEERSGARLITLIEDRERKGYEELTRLLPRTGRAHVLGITGPAGAGKSTIIAKLAGRFSDQGKKVGIIAIDPTSMQSHGAVLGDRVRMQEAERPGEIFIRSMADRDHPGGVSRAALGAVYVMEGLGKDVVIIESVGAGQSDKALFYICDTVVTLFTPEFGDEIQLLKAGLLEIGDIVVVNKSDKAGSDDAMRAISAFLPKKSEGEWSAPILLTKAHISEGLDDLIRNIELHWTFLLADNQRVIRRKQKITFFMMTLLKEELWRRFTDTYWKERECEQIVEEAQTKVIDPYTAVERIADIVEARLQKGA
jgi:LAO/AO transport system kinase